MTKLKETLRKLGLTNSEIKVYCELMKQKKATIVELTKLLQMHRPNIYESLNRLINKGLVINNGTEYHINDFEKLLDYIEVMKTKLDEKKAILSAILPETNISETKPKIMIYEGVNGLKSVFEEMLRTAKMNHCIGAWDQPYIMEWFFKNWHNRRVKQGFIDKLIFSESGRDRGEELNKMDYTCVKYLDKNAHSPSALNIFDNKVFLIIGSKINPTGILIEDERVANDFLDYFKVLWKSAKM